MCNQFQLASLAEISKYLIQDLNLPLVEPAAQLPQAQQIFPQAAAPVLLFQDKQLILDKKTWGYPSLFANKVIFNARIERFFAEKPSLWNSSFAKRRCLIIAKQFFESGPQTYLASNGRRYHERFSFRNETEPLTLIAGIYQEDHFAMVTTAPNSVMAPLHDRMPLVIQPQELRQWLFQNFTSLLDRSQIPLAVSKIPQRQ
ncbi:SOS response-associated peptidase family protein [Lactobacillus xylocopicola]|uniref:Abasic site processing protein n=1 Tax=Lactobacillus xylocopicola TaxID=2976676 RepID=A0ABN6SN71_9LACO|nr:SOS response-associated peptidase family protein [Lactobacillus xylocopicola]BDR61014.1 DUF159 family protein [Lactobacillus xylocopicola]